MRYTQKTSSSHEHHRVSNNQYQFDKLELVHHVAGGKHWDERNQRWVRTLRTVTHGVNAESDSVNSHQIKVDARAEQCKGYDPYSLGHW